MEHDMMAPANGDADRDFAAIMIPHHQDAMEMAEAEPSGRSVRSCRAMLAQPGAGW